MVSFTEQMLTRTLDWNLQGNTVTGLVGSRVIGSVGVAGASLVDVIHRIIGAAYYGLLATYATGAGIYHVGCAVLKPQAIRPAVEYFAVEYFKVILALEAATTQVKLAWCHAAGAAAALTCGAIAPQKLLMPAMRSLGVYS